MVIIDDENLTDPQMTYIHPPDLTLLFSPKCSRSVMTSYRRLYTSSIVNIQIDPAWTQATLLMTFGGLGVYIRSAGQLPPPIAGSAAACTDLVHLITISETCLSCTRRMLWLSDPWAMIFLLLKVYAQQSQKAWDLPRVIGVADSL